MGSTKGRPRPAGAGRKKGTPNKRTEAAQELATRLGVDPFEILLHYASRNHDALKIPETRTKYNAKGMPYEEDSISTELAQKSAKDATEYLRPKLKNVELTGKDGGDVFGSFAAAVSALVKADEKEQSGNAPANPS